MSQLKLTDFERAQRAHEQAARDSLEWEEGMYRMRNGGIGNVFCTDAGKTYPLRGTSYFDGLVGSAEWTKDGRFYTKDFGFAWGYDLMPPGYEPLSKSPE